MFSVGGRDRKALDTARTMIETEQASCAVIRDGEIIHSADGRGIAPLLNLLDNSPEKLSGSLVVDRIIGRAAAMVLTCGRARAVYALTISRAGLEYLESHGIGVAFDRRIDLISNRTGDGVCPLEHSVLDINDPQKGIAKLRDTIKQLAAGRPQS